MFHTLESSISRAVSGYLKTQFQLDVPVAAEQPKQSDFGELALPVAFQLARQLKKAPKVIAEELAAGLAGKLIGVAALEVAGNGYINIRLDRGAYAASVLASGGSSSAEAKPGKIIVEHTNINPNKAAHIGHLRNAILGDTFVRMMKAMGTRVEVQNYIDNTGVQVADVVVGFVYLENKDLAAIKALDAELTAEGKSFDYYCWNLYTKVGVEYQTNEGLKEKRAEVLHLVEEGGNVTAELADYVATRNVECILDTMERLSIRYDLLPRESEILHLHFWDRAFEQMKQLGVIHYETEGKQAGCWVMPFEEHSGDADNETDKILVRSNGTVTYTGKDIAYQMWKLGILGLDFNYRLFHTYQDGRQVWITTAERNSEGSADTRVRLSAKHEDNLAASGDAEKSARAPIDVPSFGGGETIYNVIDTRQSYPQDIVRKGVAAI